MYSCIEDANVSRIPENIGNDIVNFHNEFPQADNSEVFPKTKSIGY